MTTPLSTEYLKKFKTINSKFQSKLIELEKKLDVVISENNILVNKNNNLEVHMQNAYIEQQQSKEKIENLEKQVARHNKLLMFLISSDTIEMPESKKMQFVNMQMEQMRSLAQHSVVSSSSEKEEEKHIKVQKEDSDIESEDKLSKEKQKIKATPKTKAKSKNQEGGNYDSLLYNINRRAIFV